CGLGRRFRCGCCRRRMRDVCGWLRYRGACGRDARRRLWSANESIRCAEAEHLLPARPGIRNISVERAIDDEMRHLLDDMLEIKFGDAIALEVGRGIQEVDGPGHAVFD